MDKEILLNHIISNYDVNINLSTFKIYQIEQYPHVFKLEDHNCSLIIKIIDKNKIHCKNLNVLYTELSNINSIEKPIFTKDKKYMSHLGNQIILLYKNLDKITKYPEPIWWSNCLSDIHFIHINNNYSNCFPHDFYVETTKLLKKAQKFMKIKIKIKIKKILKIAQASGEILNNHMVLCHNDPYNLNVMSINGEYRLIDTDGMGVSPREFDIQRLICNYLIYSNDVCSSLSFWDTFKKNYEFKTNEKIDINLLKKIYALDLIRTISWLYIVSNDLSREDRERQKERLNLFERSIRNDVHIKMLKIIK